LDSISLQTSQGRTLGKYGGTGGGGKPYQFSGPVYGLFGTCCWDKTLCISGLGAWTANPSPPPPSPPPAVAKQYIYLGPFYTKTWDDGAHTGECSPSSASESEDPRPPPIPLPSFSALQSTCEAESHSWLQILWILWVCILGLRWCVAINSLVIIFKTLVWLPWIWD
jgi:hypothetical protein